MSLMRESSKENEKRLEVLRNFDFLARSKNAGVFLFTSDYRGEGAAETAQEIAGLLREIYRLGVAVLDLRRETLEQSRDARSQNVFCLDWLLSGEKVNERKLDQHVRTLKESNDLVFLLQDVKREPSRSWLPEISVDGAIMVRSPKSVGAGKSRYVTKMVQDADIPLMGMIYNKV